MYPYGHFLIPKQKQKWQLHTALYQISLSILVHTKRLSTADTWMGLGPIAIAPTYQLAGLQMVCTSEHTEALSHGLLAIRSSVPNPHRAAT